MRVRFTAVCAWALALSAAVLVSEIPLTIQSGRMNQRVNVQLGGGGPTVRVITTNGPVKIETSD